MDPWVRFHWEGAIFFLTPSHSSVMLAIGIDQLQPSASRSLSVIVLFSLSFSKPVKVYSYIAQYPVLRIAQSALHFTSLIDMFNQTPSQLLWEASSHMLHLMHMKAARTHICHCLYPGIQLYSYVNWSYVECKN